MTRNFFSVRGRVRVQAIKPDGRIFSDTGWKHNLILNQGMDGMATRLIADNFTNCCLGDATNPTREDSGTTVISQNNVTVTLSGGAFTFTDTATDAGKVIKWDTGQTATIVAVLTPLTATVNTSTIIAPGEFGVYQTRQTGLFNEIKRTNTYFTIGGACATVSMPPNVLVLRRTFNFPIEVGLGTTYNEVGLSHSAAAGNNLFSRILLDSPTFVPPGLRPRVVYELQITIYPGSPVNFSAIVSGWPVLPATNLNAQQNNEMWGLAGITSLGATSPINTVSGVPILANEPSEPCDMLISSSSAALNSPGDAPLNRWQAGDAAFPATNVVYTPGTFRRQRRYIFTTADGVMSNLRTFSIGHIITPSSDFLPVMTVLFDQNQTKSGSFLLSLEFQLNWSRTFA